VQGAGSAIGGWRTVRRGRSGVCRALSGTEGQVLEVLRGRERRVSGGSVVKYKDDGGAVGCWMGLEDSEWRLGVGCSHGWGCGTRLRWGTLVPASRTQMATAGGRGRTRARPRRDEKWRGAPLSFSSEDPADKPLARTVLRFFGDHPPGWGYFLSCNTQSLRRQKRAREPAVRKGPRHGRVAGPGPTMSMTAWAAGRFRGV
jgi:hypothetical protein